MKAGVLGTLFGGLIWSFAAGAAAASLTADVDGIRVEVKSEPEKPVRDRKTTYTARLVDAAGTPVTEARVRVVSQGRRLELPLREEVGR
ncbi:MAG: hypothetical protein A3F92_17040 [Candidatus Rokubacteria bacterium RIFCSPLOWO2_12_FULL_71_22]|nr:MAG: hypothetical protein A3F92_17040 [Candidatus Rokubacteria bacterium RIFCSPLOWO2_12_FULL_71_22]